MTLKEKQGVGVMSKTHLPVEWSVARYTVLYKTHFKAQMSRHNTICKLSGVLQEFQSVKKHKNKCKMVIGDFNDIVCLSIDIAAFVGSTYFFCKTVLQLCLLQTTPLKEEKIDIIFQNK